jgi:hypothetical protein
MPETELDRAKRSALTGWPEGADVPLTRLNEYLRTLGAEEQRQARAEWWAFLWVHRDEEADDA